MGGTGDKDPSKCRCRIEPPSLIEVIEEGHAVNCILECAAAAKAEYLVTGDRCHKLPVVQHQSVSIVNAHPLPVNSHGA